jgi:hypothetical protein
MNRFLVNAHSVPLVDLFTLNTLIILLIAYGLKYMEWCDDRSCAAALIGLVVVSVMLHSYLGIPDNLSYYFGWGEKPVGWRGAQ